MMYQGVNVEGLEAYDTSAGSSSACPCGQRKHNEPDEEAIDLISTGIKVGVVVATCSKR